MSTIPIQNLQRIQNELTRGISLTLLIAGTIGNVLNCILFTRRSLRHNPCSIYFFATSVANIIALYFSCLTRLLMTFGTNTTSSQGSIYCRFRTFFTFMPLTASTWFIVAACADRYASSSSSVRIRSFSQVKFSQRIIYAIIFISSAIWGQILLPPLLMFILGWLTIQHIRHRPINRLSNSKERQLNIMLITQVICVAILSLPTSIEKIYSEITMKQVKSAERLQIEANLAFMTLPSCYLFSPVRLTQKIV
ncbi:unnamed protein product [Rotaria sp. Silwood2]|nr:unnamed protein product [Rotaria sp. Silwood2]CAF4495559.1 unnamed protein product [Rotaria sp. Silwood2]